MKLKPFITTVGASLVLAASVLGFINNQINHTPSTQKDYTENTDLTNYNKKPDYNQNQGGCIFYESLGLPCTYPTERPVQPTPTVVPTPQPTPTIQPTATVVSTAPVTPVPTPTATPTPVYESKFNRYLKPLENTIENNRFDILENYVKDSERGYLTTLNLERLDDMEKLDTEFPAHLENYLKDHQDFPEIVFYDHTDNTIVNTLEFIKENPNIINSIDTQDVRLAYEILSSRIIREKYSNSLDSIIDNINESDAYPILSIRTVSNVLDIIATNTSNKNNSFPENVFTDSWYLHNATKIQIDNENPFYTFKLNAERIGHISEHILNLEARRTSTYSNSVRNAFNYDTYTIPKNRTLSVEFNGKKYLIRFNDIEEEIDDDEITYLADISVIGERRREIEELRSERFDDFSIYVLDLENDNNPKVTINIARNNPRSLEDAVSDYLRFYADENIKSIGTGISSLEQAYEEKDNFDKLLNILGLSYAETLTHPNEDIFRRAEIYSKVAGYESMFVKIYAIDENVVKKLPGFATKFTDDELEILRNERDLTPVGEWSVIPFIWNSSLENIIEISSENEILYSSSPVEDSLYSSSTTEDLFEKIWNFFSNKE